MDRQIPGEVAVKAALAAAWFPVTPACKVNLPAADDSADQTWEKDRSGLEMCGRESWQKAQHLEIIFHPLLWDFFTLMIARSHILAQLYNYFKLFFGVKLAVLPWRHYGNYSTRGQRETNGS